MNPAEHKPDISTEFMIISTEAVLYLFLYRTQLSSISYAALSFNKLTQITHPINHTLPSHKLRST